MFWLRRQIKKTPRFLLAEMEAKEAAQQAACDRTATDLRSVLAERRLLRWLIGASLAWLLFDFVYYGNTVAGVATGGLGALLRVAGPVAGLRLRGVADWAACRDDHCAPLKSCPALEMRRTMKQTFHRQALARGLAAASCQRLRWAGARAGDRQY